MKSTVANNFMAWISLFVLAWLVILKVVTVTPVIVILFVVFLVIGIFTGILMQEERKK